MQLDGSVANCKALGSVQLFPVVVVVAVLGIGKTSMVLVVLTMLGVLVVDLDLLLQTWAFSAVVWVVAAMVMTMAVVVQLLRTHDSLAASDGIVQQCPLPSASSFSLSPQLVQRFGLGLVALSSAVQTGLTVSNWILSVAAAKFAIQPARCPAPDAAS